VGGMSVLQEMNHRYRTRIPMICMLALVLTLAGCGSKTGETVQSLETKNESANYSKTDSDRAEDKTSLPETVDNSDSEETADQVQKADAEDMEMIMAIDGTEVSVVWENNESVEAIRELAASGGLEINMSMYGGFEQVGSIGQSIPRNDEQIKTKAGDIVLYSGNQVVVFYGSNSWAYTRLGRITDKTAEELAEMLGNGDVVLGFAVK